MRQLLWNLAPMRQTSYGAFAHEAVKSCPLGATFYGMPPPSHEGAFMEVRAHEGKTIWNSAPMKEELNVFATHGSILYHNQIL